MPGNFPASPKNLHQARKPGIIFQSRIFFKNKTNYLIFMGIIYKFRQIGLYGPKECKFRQKLCFMIPSKKLETRFSTQPGKIFLEE